MFCQEWTCHMSFTKHHPTVASPMPEDPGRIFGYLRIQRWERLAKLQGACPASTNSQDPPDTKAEDSSRTNLHLNEKKQVELLKHLGHSSASAFKELYLIHSVLHVFLFSQEVSWNGSSIPHKPHNPSTVLSPTPLQQ